VEDYRSTAAATEAYARRWVETVFGELKTSRGLRQAQLRGYWKVQVQALLTFAVHNDMHMIRSRTDPETDRIAYIQSNAILSTFHATWGAP